MQPWKYARVGYVRGAGATIAASIQAWAVAGPTIPQAGLTQDDAIQLAADLSVLRHAVTSSLWKFAQYDQDGTFRGEIWGTDDDAGAVSQYGGPMFIVVGDEPVRSRVVGGNDELGDEWGAKLAKAIDRILLQIRDAEQAASVPMGFGAIVLPIIAPAVAAIIVGGVAVGIIGSVAAWRYLDPNLRVRVAAIRAAADAYATRLSDYQRSAILLPPSPIETANAEAVAEAAHEGGRDGWVAAAAAGGGILVGTLALTAIRKAAAA